MSPRPHDGPAEEGLSSSLLPIVQDEEQVDRLRSVLSSFCHRCRNSLNGIKLSLYLFRRESCGGLPDRWAEIETIYQQVEQLFERLQTIYRPIPITMVRRPVDELIRQHEPRWRSRLGTRGIHLRIDLGESEVIGDFDPAQLGVGLDALASWMAEVGSRGARARVSLAVRDDSIEIAWELSPPHSGPIPMGHPDPVIQSSRELSTHRLDSLALPLVARIVAEHGGLLECERGANLRVLLSWPRYRAGDRNGVA